MRRQAPVLALSLLTSAAGTAQGEAATPAQAHAGADPDAPRGRYTLNLHARAGVSQTPFSAPFWPQQAGAPVATVIAQAAYSPTPSLSFGLRVPVVEAFIERPAGSLVEETALGNVELSATWRRPLVAGLGGAVRFALGAPSEGNVTPSAAHYPNAALALGSALEGWRYPELFAPGRLPLTVAGRLDYERAWLAAGLELKLPFLLQVQPAAAPANVDTHRLALTPLLTLHASASAFGRVFLTARGWLAWNAVWPAELAGRDLSRFQAAVQPQISCLLGEHALLALDATLPLGGELGGRVWSGALSAAAFF